MNARSKASGAQKNKDAFFELLTDRFEKSLNSEPLTESLNPLI